MEEIQNAQFAAKAVEPHSTQSDLCSLMSRGFRAPLAGAHFYLTGVRDAKGERTDVFRDSAGEVLERAREEATEASPSAASTLARRSSIMVNGYGDHPGYFRSGPCQI